MYLLEDCARELNKTQVLLSQLPQPPVNYNVLDLYLPGLCIVQLA